MDFLRIMELCHQHGVSIEVPGEGPIAFDTNQAKLIASIKAFLAAEERQRISERTKAGLASAKKRGVKLGRPPGTRTNKGYRKTYDPQIVSDVQALSKKGVSARQIAEILAGKWELSASTVLRFQRRHSILTS